MYYDNLFMRDIDYVLFMVTTLQESERVSSRLASLGYYPDSVVSNIATSIIKNGVGYYAISKGVSRVQFAGSYLGEPHGGFCKNYPRWYITTIDNARIEYSAIDL